MKEKSRAFNYSKLEELFAKLLSGEDKELDELEIAKSCLNPGFKWTTDRHIEYYSLKTQWFSRHINYDELKNALLNRRDTADNYIQPLYGAPVPNMNPHDVDPKGLELAVSVDKFVKRLNKTKLTLTVNEFESIDIDRILFMSKTDIVKYKNTIHKLISAGVFDDDDNTEEEKVNE